MSEWKCRVCGIRSSTECHPLHMGITTHCSINTMRKVKEGDEAATSCQHEWTQPSSTTRKYQTTEPDPACRYLVVTDHEQVVVSTVCKHCGEIKIRTEPQSQTFAVRL